MEISNIDFEKLYKICRIMRRVEFSMTDCWIWTGTKSNGYGQIRDGKNIVYVHKLILKILGIDIPKEAIICHLCDNPSCINPEHLSVGNTTLNGWDKYILKIPQMVKILREHGFNVIKISD